MEKRSKVSENVQCCLRDCGLSEDSALAYADAVSKNDYYKQIHLLEQQRRKMLDEIHDVSRKIDCIDYIIRQCKEQLSMED